MKLALTIGIHYRLQCEPQCSHPRRLRNIEFKLNSARFKRMLQEFNQEFHPHSSHRPTRHQTDAPNQVQSHAPALHALNNRKAVTTNRSHRCVGHFFASFLLHAALGTSANVVRASVLPVGVARPSEAFSQPPRENRE